MLKKRRTTKTFIEDSIKIHGENTYSYGTTVFSRIHDKVEIFCNTHNKSFMVDPSKHLHSKQGCQLCSYSKHRSKAKIKDTDYFINKAIAVHGDLYDYSNSVYTLAKNNISIYCKKCKKDFIQVASTHLNGSGCMKCGHDNGKIKQKGNSTSFIEKAIKVHGNLYSYDKLIYGNNNVDKVLVTCSLCNYTARTSPSNFLNGSKPACNCTKHFGFQDSKPGILYYLSINSGEAYKIGITNRSIEDRFYNYDLQKIKIISEYYFLNGTDARDIETNILNKFKDYKYNGKQLLSTGNSELFNCDITKLPIV